MDRKIFSVIAGSGVYIPKKVVPNSDFLKNEFFDEAGNRIEKANEEIVNKLGQITQIEERRYVEGDKTTSDIAHEAGLEALKSAGVNKEELDYIIVAHNFGDVKDNNRRSDFMPTLAARVKHKMRIVNPYTVCYDVTFGCPGWVQAMIQANFYIRSGEAKNILIIGAEVLSRMVDPHDMNSMIFSDGAGAVVLKAVESDKEIGIIAHKTRSDTFNEAYFLKMGESFNKEKSDGTIYAKMEGHKIYEYALSVVPSLVKESIDAANLGIIDINKVLIHQANGKMDEAIMKRLFRLYGENTFPEEIMPMTIEKFGNNSVATIPILYDLISKEKYNGHEFHSGDNIVMTSVGAGMNVNSIIYKMP